MFGKNHAFTSVLLPFRAIVQEGPEIDVRLSVTQSVSHEIGHRPDRGPLFGALAKVW